MHVLVGSSDEDYEHLLEHGAAARAAEDWVVPKRAVIGEAAVLYIPSVGFIASATIASAPRPATFGNRPVYRADLRDLQLFPAAFTLEDVTEQVPEWGWLNQRMKSRTTAEGDVADALNELVRRATGHGTDSSSDGHFVAYQSMERWGAYENDSSAQFRFVTRKRTSADKWLGARLWAIASEGTPARYRYRLRETGIIADVTEDDPRVVTAVTDASFDRDVSTEGWFKALKREQNNFSYGLNRISSPAIIQELERLRSQGSDRERGGVAPGRSSFFATADEQELSQRVASLMRGRIPKPRGNARPRRVAVGSQERIERCPEVVAWVLQETAGSCELCGKRAPFVGADGRPFLEVHHVKRLVDGGPDVPANAVGVCPNCHRALHHARDRHERRETLYRCVSRLKRC